MMLRSTAGARLDLRPTKQHIARDSFLLKLEKFQ